jgi:uncharacterized phage protein (TIGR02218 family)
MTYIAQETSPESSQPVELYLFSQRLGTARTALTSGTLPVEKDGDLYLPSTIKRSAPKLAQGASGSKITVTVPRDHEYALRYLTGEPPLPDKVTIFRGHSTDPTGEWRILFSGEVAGVRFEADTAKIILVSLSSRLKRSVPKRTFSWTCNHVLYDTQCGVDRNDFHSFVDVVSTDTTRLLLTVLDTVGNQTSPPSATTRCATDALFFDGGYMEVATATGTFHRTIAHYDHVAHTILLTVPLDDAFPGSTMKLFAGCFHDINTCLNKFNNRINYGGFPFVPTTNPFADGLIKGR